MPRARPDSTPVLPPSGALSSYAAARRACSSLGISLGADPGDRGAPARPPTAGRRPPPRPLAGAGPRALASRFDARKRPPGIPPRQRLAAAAARRAAAAAAAARTPRRERPPGAPASILDLPQDVLLLVVTRLQEREAAVAACAASAFRDAATLATRHFFAFVTPARGPRGGALPRGPPSAAPPAARPPRAKRAAPAGRRAASPRRARARVAAPAPAPAASGTPAAALATPSGARPASSCSTAAPSCAAPRALRFQDLSIAS